jgi:hypothetical protein
MKLLNEFRNSRQGQRRRSRRGRDHRRGLQQDRGVAGGDIVMPIIGRIVGKLDFSNLFIVLADVRRARR